MKLTKLRVFNGSKATLDKPTVQQLKDLIVFIEVKMQRLGFEVFGDIINSTHIKLGSNKCQFRIIVERLGYNTRVNPHLNLKRTRVPGWDQRVKFNNTLNQIMDELDFSANVVSGPFTIRQGLQHFTESDWHNQKPEWIQSNEARGFGIEEYDYKETA